MTARARRWSAGRSDPANLQRDEGPNALGTRHSFNGSIVARTSFTRGSPMLQKLLADITPSNGYEQRKFSFGVRFRF